LRDIDPLSSPEAKAVTRAECDVAQARLEVAEVSLKVAQAGVTTAQYHLSLAKVLSLIKTAKPNTPEERKVADDVLTATKALYMIGYDDWFSLQSKLNDADAKLNVAKAELKNAYTRLDSRVTSHPPNEEMLVGKIAEAVAKQMKNTQQPMKTVRQTEKSALRSLRKSQANLDVFAENLT